MLQSLKVLDHRKSINPSAWQGCWAVQVHFWGVFHCPPFSPAFNQENLSFSMRSPSPSLDWDNWNQCWPLIYPPAGSGFSLKLPSVAVHNFYFLAQFPFFFPIKFWKDSLWQKWNFRLDLNPLSGHTSSGLTLTLPGTFLGCICCSPGSGESAAAPGKWFSSEF